MSRRVLILPAALLILGACVAIAHSPRVESQPAPSAAEDDSPGTCVARLLAAEASGDSGAYLDCFGRPQRAKLESVWQGRSTTEISTELRRQSAGLVGWAVIDVTFADADRADLVFERIHKDYTARQQMNVVRDGARWQIAELFAAERQTPTVPYGTPVFTPR
jgi:hypothetical protein